jgi:hypothetical protein
MPYESCSQSVRSSLSHAEHTLYLNPFFVNEKISSCTIRSVKGQEKVAKDIRRLEAMQRYAAPQHKNVLQPLITVISRCLGSSPSALDISSALTVAQIPFCERIQEAYSNQIHHLQATTTKSKKNLCSKKETHRTKSCQVDDFPHTNQHRKPHK